MSQRTEQTQAYALEYLDAGLVPIPTRLDGSKSPAVSTWRDYQTERPSREQVASWFSRPAGIAVLMGVISGGAETIDFDDPEPCWPILNSLDSDLRNRLAIYETPKGGWHVVYRCEEIFKSAKLARRSDKTTRIESRGESSYIIAEGSPIAVHNAGVPYCHYMGRRLATLATITPTERKSIWMRCVQYDQTGEPSPATKQGRLLAEQEYRAANPVIVDGRSIERASRYLATMEPAIQGSNGSGACFRAACKLVGHFGLSADDALHLMLTEFNSRCVPPWSEHEIAHKVADAIRKTGRFELTQGIS